MINESGVRTLRFW